MYQFTLGTDAKNKSNTETLRVGIACPKKKQDPLERTREGNIEENPKPFEPPNTPHIGSNLSNFDQPQQKIQLVQTVRVDFLLII